MLSHYFEDLYKGYQAELEDLETDSEGKNVLAKRLNEKRAQFTSLLPMITVAPEMVAPVFHGAISFRDPHAMVMLSFAEPEDFPAWAILEPTVQFESWAQKNVALVLHEPGGEQFLIATICLEFLYEKNSGQLGQANASPADHHDGDNDRDEADAAEQDLDEAGADWLADQGFDRRG